MNESIMEKMGINPIIPRRKYYSRNNTPPVMVRTCSESGRTISRIEIRKDLIPRYFNNAERVLFAYVARSNRIYIWANPEGFKLYGAKEASSVRVGSAELYEKLRTCGVYTGRHESNLQWDAEAECYYIQMRYGEDVARYRKDGAK